MIARKRLLRSTARAAIYHPSPLPSRSPLAARPSSITSSTGIRTYAQGPPGNNGNPPYGGGGGGGGGPRGPGGPGGPGGPFGGGGNPFGGMRFPGQQAAPEKGEYLKQFSVDLTDLARKGKLDPVIGRDEEIRRTIQILSRRSKSNPVLLGLAVSLANL